MQASTRQSNFELLRAFAALLVLVVHCNGIFLNVYGEHDWTSGGNVIMLWRTTIESIAFLGVNLFILISGYFSIKPKLKSVLTIFSVLIFFYTGGYFVDCALGYQTLTLKGTIMSFVESTEDNWFIQCYLYLMFLAPMINWFMDKLNEKQASFFTLAYIALSIYFGCLRPSPYIYFNSGYSISTVMLIYIIGRYLKLWGENRFKKVSNLWLIAIFFFAIAAATAVRIIHFRIAFFCGYHSPIVIIPAMALFLLFGRMKFQSRFVNWVGASGLAVFIFHTCAPVFRQIVKYDNLWFDTCPLWKWIVYMSCMIAVVYVLSILLDKVREFLCKPILNYAGKLDCKIENMFKS